MKTEFIPPWQDTPTLCKNICATPNTVTAWVSERILPPPRKRGGKLMWKWSEVDEWLTVGPPQGTSDPQADEIRNNVKRALETRADH